SAIVPEGKSLASQHSQFRCFMIRMKRFLILEVFGALIAAMAQGATNFDLAAQATNELAVDLHRQLATGNENLCVSPYSIESALAMTFAGAAFEHLDFITDASRATQHTNHWVADQTHDRSRDLIPAEALNKMTRLVLANALYLKAAWADSFSEKATQPEPFHVRGGTPVDVPTMNKRAQFGFAKREGFIAVSLPYVGNDLQFLVLLPDDVNGLRALESKLTASMLAECAKLETREEVDLHLPKFKFEPPTIALAEKLQVLGMKNAFDIPRGSANFDGIAPRKPNDYLYISNVFHKTFIAVDEKGTEAAAATAVVMMRATAMAGPKPKPIEVRVDRPFVYAIQHVPSGVCLFLGRVTDPR